MCGIILIDLVTHSDGLLASSDKCFRDVAAGQLSLRRFGGALCRLLHRNRTDPNHGMHIMFVH